MPTTIEGAKSFKIMLDDLEKDFQTDLSGTWMRRTFAQLGNFVRKKIILAMPAYSEAVRRGGLKGRRPAIPQDFFPKRTGHLRNSLKRGQVTPSSVELIAKAPYASIIHDGGRNRTGGYIPPQPFISDPVEENADEIVAEFRRGDCEAN